jgi:RNA recognition motif-containing protein
MSSSSVIIDPRGAPSRNLLAQTGEYSNQMSHLDSSALIVEIEGLPYDFAFDEADLLELFSRYGQVKTVEFLDHTIAPDIALVEFHSLSDATSAANHLNKYSLLLDGAQIVLSVYFYDEVADKELQSKLKMATVMALHQSGPAAVMTGSKYLGSTSITNGQWQCRFVVGGEKMEKEFPIVGRIIGPQGSHMKSIHESTGAKLRLRGRRSNYKEGPDNKEVDEPMHICVSSNDEGSFRRACEMVETLMAGVYNDYSEWCHQNKIPIPNIQLLCIEGPFTESLDWKLRDYYAAQAQMLSMQPPVAR